MGAALVRGALEAAGAVGAAPFQIPPRRLLFVETAAGRAAAVRALEADLHVEGGAGGAESAAELARFVRQVVLVGGGEGGGSAEGARVARAAALDGALFES